MSRILQVEMLGAAAVLLGAFGTAHAAPAFVYTGTDGTQFEMKFSGRTTEVSPLPGVGTGLETTWGVGYVNEFQNKNNPSQKLWQSSVPGFGNATITYFLYGISDARISGTSPNVNIYNVGCTVGPNCDGKIHIDFYIDEAGAGGTNPSFTDPANGASARVGTTVNDWTDDTFLMSWELVPGVVPSDDPSTPTFDETQTVLLQTVTSASLPATGVGVFFANCVAGPGCDILGVTPTTWTDLGSPVVADLFGRFNLATTTPAEQLVGWLGDTFDPVRGITSVPEPAAIVVFGAALLGLAGMFARNRRRS